MKSVVMGGGLIGVTTAYFLAKEGHQVTVLERNAEPGLETSFQNGALLAPGHAQAWASPGAPMTLVRSLFQDDPAIRFRLSLDPRFWRWGLRFLGQCTSERYRANTLRTLRAMMYGVDVLRTVKRDSGIDDEGNDKGVLYLFRSQESLDKHGSSWTLLKEHGLALEEVDRRRAAAIEPALEPNKDKVAGGFFAPNDGSGDAFVFTRKLAERAGALGVEFRFGVTIRGLRTNGAAVEAVATDKGEVTGDAYVLALAAYSPAIARQVGLDLPIWPVKGYTMSVPVDGYNGAPQVGIIEEDNLVAFARLGDRVRVGGKAEFAGYDTSYGPRDFKGLHKVARDLFPEGGDYAKAKYWACLRPVTPTGTPLLGRARHKNLYVHAGHGAAGWTMGCGTSRALVDLMAGRAPALDLEGLTLESA